MGKGQDDEAQESSDSDSSGSDDGSDSSSSSSSSGSDDAKSGSESGSGGDSGDGAPLEVGFWQSMKAVMPWTKEGEEADYAEERLDAHEEFEEELNQALYIRKMVDTGMHDRALARLMASTEGQMYHDFHKHRHILEQSGEWSFIAPSVRRKWRIAGKETDNVLKLREYTNMRRDRFLRIRALCRDVRNAGFKSSAPVVTVVPSDLIDGNLLAMAETRKRKSSKPPGSFGGARQKKCHWRNISSTGEACICTNYRMEHPHRLFRDEFGALVHDTLATCGWHASHCVSKVHGDDPVVVSIANEGALCNECLAQITKGPIKKITAFGAPGVRINNKKRAGSADTNPGPGGDEFLAWNKWFTKGPGRSRRAAVRRRHPNAPPGVPPSGLRDPAVFEAPPPPPPVFSIANLKRQKALVKWRLRKEQGGGLAATAVQKTYRGYRTRRLRDIAALESTEKARLRVESAIVVQSLIRRFLARVLVTQIAAFRNVHATVIQRVVRGMQARAVFRKTRAKAMIRRQMLYYIARAFCASARVAKTIRDDMQRKNAMALSLQRAWRGKVGRDRAAALRANRMRRVGAAILVQKAWRCCLSRAELRRRQLVHWEEVRAATIMQSVFRMAVDRRRALNLRHKFDTAVRKLQPFVRGMLARAAARRLRATLNQMWGWLGTDATTANDLYARFLPKNAYSVSTREEGGRTPTPAGVEMENKINTPEKDLDFERSPSKANLETVRGERHFTEAFDKDRTGTCSKVEFKMGLESFCRDVGYPLQKEEALRISRRFCDGDGFCGWHSILSAYNTGEGGIACARHCRLLCSLCVRHGRCEKSGCFCAKARAGRSKQLGFKMCECGHRFDVHALLAGGSNSSSGGRVIQRGCVVPEKKLNSLFSGRSAAVSTDRPINVEGSPATSALSPAAKITTPVPINNNSLRKRKPQRRVCQTKVKIDPAEEGDVRALMPPFFGKRRSADGRAVLSPSRYGHLGNADNVESKETTAVPESSELVPRALGGKGRVPPAKRSVLPTLQEAREAWEDYRETSWAGKRGQAERAARAEMNSTVQGQGAADYAVRLREDIAANTAMGDGRPGVALAQSKKELRTGFAISDAVPFVKAGILKATTDPIGLYLYLLQTLSDERRELLQDDRRFNDFVARHAVFLERHWCKLVKDIRNGSIDPHLPVAQERRTRIEALMIPNKKRAKKLDDILRVLGFHSRASGSYKMVASATCSVKPSKRKGATAVSKVLRSGQREEGLTQEEKEESMWKKIEASKKKRPETPAETTASGTGTEPRRRRSVAGGELESVARLVRARARSRERSPSAGAVRAIPTPSQASQTAYELQTSASDTAAGVVRATSGRGVRKHVCLHPGCGKVFHLKESAAAHQEKDHRFRRKLATSTPFVDQFMSAAWPAECIPWTTTPPPGSHDEHRTLPATTPSRREGSHTTPTTPATTPNRDRIVAHGDEACLNARFTCKVPGCTHRFISARLLGLHLRMGHSDFDLEKIKAVENEGGMATLTHDGLPVQSSTCVEGHSSATFLGAYHLVPPFLPPAGCPAIPACAQHSRIKEGCRRCEEVERLATPAVALDAAIPTTPSEAEGRSALTSPSEEEPRVFLGSPVPPVKFFTRARVTVHHRGKPLALDLHCADTLRYPLLSFPRSALPVNANHPYPLRPVTDGDATVVTDSATRPLATREERDHEHTTEELHAGDDMEFRIAREREGEGGHENTVPELKVDSDPKSQGKKKSREGGGEFEGSDGCLDSSRNILASSAHGKSRGSDVAAAAALGASGGTTPRGRSTSKREPTTTLRHRRQDHQPVSGFQGESNTNHRHPSQHQPMPDESITDHHHPPRNQTSRSFKGESILHHRHPQRDGQLLPVFTGEPPIKHHQQDQSIPATKGESATNHQRHPPHKHQLVPARLVAVLLDGAGKGWMAVKRLWSVREVGVEALAKAGLSFAEVDREQEFFVGTALEYLPLSLLRDTCTITVNRKDDVHSKQRLGEFPKHFRFVSHGVNSETGAVLLESELKQREEQILQGG